MRVRKTLVSPSRDHGQVEIPHLQFAGLSGYDRLVHAVFTRHGGFSDTPYDRLNVSTATGDREERVAANLALIRDVIGARRLVGMTQVHGTRIAVLDDARAPEPGQADALVTSLPGVALMVKQADCQAVILFDPVKAVVANVHCGWRGNAADILEGVVSTMKARFGCDPAVLRAAIGPSLGPCCAEFTTFETVFPDHFRRFMVSMSHFDLWEISRSQLLQAGLRKENIERAGVCTRCRTDLFFSYRGEGVTGRFATVVMLQ